MVLSMTGFGACQISRSGVMVRVELRSVNHRFFDPSIRISRDFQGLEARVKERLGARITRGRVNASVDVQAEDAASRLTLDETLAGSYKAILQTLGRDYGIGGDPDPVTFAQLPDLVRRETPEISLEVAAPIVDEALEGALSQLTSMRTAEGAALEKDFRARVGRLQELLQRIDAASTGSSQRVRQRLEERIRTLVPEGTEVDSDRLATEVALLAEKADIAEELVRFSAHNDAFLGFLDRTDAKGKRLDFLLQEMNREGNTIGSKSVSADVAHLVVEVKEEIERLREQVQNVE